MDLLELETKIKRFYEAHRKLVISTLAICIALLMVADHYYFHDRVQSILDIVALIEVSLIVTFMILVAGAVVIKALLDVAVGLSLVIFLAQAYCDSPIHTAAGNGALQTLLVFGLGYVAYDFATKLYQGIRGFFKTLKQAKWDLFKVVISAMFITLAFVFVWAIYTLMNPIVLGLCIYR